MVSSYSMKSIACLREVFLSLQIDRKERFENDLARAGSAAGIGDWPAVDGRFRCVDRPIGWS